MCSKNIPFFMCPKKRSKKLPQLAVIILSLVLTACGGGGTADPAGATPPAAPTPNNESGAPPAPAANPSQPASNPSPGASAPLAPASPQSLTIDTVIDTVMSPNVNVASGGVALHSPSIGGTLGSSLAAGTTVAVFDGASATALRGVLSFPSSSQPLRWQFVPVASLNSGSHTITAKVVKSDASVVATSNPWTFKVADLGPSYGTTLAFKSSEIVAGGTALMTVQIINQSSAPVYPELLVDFPAGFTQDGFQNNLCGGTPSSNSNVVRLTGAIVQAGTTCTFAFNAHLPANATRMDYRIRNNNGSALLGITAGGGFTWQTSSGRKELSRLDMFITPVTDPGPGSNVYWANQIYNLNGYTGLQSPVLTGGSPSEGSGKQFLFSLWASNLPVGKTVLEVKTGTPASAGIGGGSFCTASPSATDGSNGAQCRYRYNWTAGHTYRFRVTPVPFDQNTNSGGPGWYQSEVTDVTPNEPNPVSFVIGQINTWNGKSVIPMTNVVTWVEYFDWNNNRTTCSTSAYSQFKMHVEAFDTLGNRVSIPPATGGPNSYCPGVSSASVDSGTNTATMTAYQNQTSQGLLKTAVAGKSLCLYGALQDNVPPSDNAALLKTCPTENDVLRDGRVPYGPNLWVMASDRTIRSVNSYCLTNADPMQPGAVFVQSCTPGSTNQLWQWDAGTPTSIRSGAPGTNTGMCLTPSTVGTNTTLKLASCTPSSVQWTVPGQSFSY